MCEIKRAVFLKDNVVDNLTSAYCVAPLNTWLKILLDNILIGNLYLTAVTTN